MNNVWCIDLLDLMDYDPGTRSGGQQLALSRPGQSHCALCGLVDNAQLIYFAFGYRQDAPKSTIGWEARVCQDCGKQGKDAVETALAPALIAEHPGAVVLPGPWPNGWFRSNDPRVPCMEDVNDGDGDDDMPF